MSIVMYLISYSSIDEKHKSMQRKLTASCKNSCFEEVVEYDESFIKNTEFFSNNKDILLEKRGAGYWIWKPYILLDMLSKVDHDDIVVYLDSHHYIGNNGLCSIIQKNTDRGAFLVEGIHRHSVWTKRDCFILMMCDSPIYYDRLQLEAGQLAFSNNSFCIDLLNEWLTFCKNNNIVTDEPNICGMPNFNGFVEHRHDQSILTNLATKYKIKCYSISMLGDYILEGRTI